MFIAVEYLLLFLRVCPDIAKGNVSVRAENTSVFRQTRIILKQFLTEFSEILYLRLLNLRGYENGQQSCMN